MDFELTEDQIELRRSVRSVLDQECPISLVREVVEKHAPASSLWATMTELDWPALTVPEDAGGLGLGFVEVVLVMEELGRAVAPGPLLGTVSQFLPPVHQAASPEQKDHLYPAVVAGELTGSLAALENGQDWPPARMATLARRSGRGWVLEGTKHLVLDGASAKELVIAACPVAGRASAAMGDGVGLFLVPRTDCQVSVIDSLDASQEQATVELRGVEVGDERVLGEPGTSGETLRRVLEEAATAMAASMVGTCQAIFDLTLGYVKQREQFGVPIGSFQAVKHKMTDMFVALERARAVMYLAALTIAEDDDGRSLAASMAKAAAGECQRLIVQDGLQLHGGIGYTWEYDLHLYLKRAQSGDAQLGTGAQHRARTAELISSSS